MSHDTVSPTGHGTGREFVRFNRVQRIEHVVQMVIFTTLVVTGIPQRYHDSVVGERLIQWMGGIEWVQAIHRICGFILIGETLFHMGHVAVLLKQKKARAWDMIPGLSDARDARDMILYFLGFRKHRARFGRYDFRQKAEYWSLIWGGVVMILSGLMMLFPTFATRYVSGEAIVAARAAHSGEALLAALAILLWHMYSAHLCADVFPFDKTIFTGKISEARILHEHPLEYERLLEEERRGPPLKKAEGPE